jgi:hypothetical protein
LGGRGERGDQLPHIFTPANKLPARTTAGPSTALGTDAPNFAQDDNLGGWSGGGFEGGDWAGGVREGMQGTGIREQGTGKGGSLRECPLMR